MSDHMWEDWAELKRRREIDPDATWADVDADRRAAELGWVAESMARRAENRRARTCEGSADE